MNNSWFLIVNPTAGNGNFNKQWNEIKNELEKKHIKYTFKKTEHASHEITIVTEAIKKGYINFISVGGDGTLHHVVNGIMFQKHIHTTKITIAVIPLGTGNDWIKTYFIPKSIKKAIQLIKEKNTVYQDIGFLELNNTSVYFNNIAGIGYDGYVVNKLKKLKRFGSIAYLLSGLYGLLFYKKTNFKIKINNTIIKTKCLMTVFGICKYSGGGMLVTDYKDSSNGLFDISIAKNITFLDLLWNLHKLYNGSFIKHTKIETHTTDKLTITPTSLHNKTYIQADGELIGTGKVKVTMCKQAIQFVIPSF